jgi:AcrR family transcriptional regulator
MSGEERRRSIAETAIDLIATYGIRGTTTARIAAAEGVSEKALYRHYASRREMLIAALDVLFERATRILRDTQEANAVDYLRAAAQLHWPSQPEFAYPLYEFFASAPQEDLRRELKIRQQADIQILVEVIEKGKAQGVIRPEVNAELAAWEFWGVCWTEDLAYMMGFDDFGSSGMSDLMIERYLAGICVQPA